MKYIKQFAIILLFTFIGEFLHTFLPLPIPASIYGLTLLFLALKFKLIAFDSVKDTGFSLIEIMPLMYIPAAVGLLESKDILAPVWVPYLVITLVSTVLVMAVAGLVTQQVRKRSVKRGNAHE